VSVVERMKIGPASLLGLCAGAVVGLAACQLALLGTARLAQFAPGMFFNTWLIALGWAACELLRGWRPSLGWLTWALVPSVLFACGLVFAHTWFFDVAIERRLTLLDMSWSGVGYFFAVALPARGLLAMLALFAGALGCACLFDRLRVRPQARHWQLLTACLALLCAPLVLLPARIPSPLFDSAQELWELATRPKVVASGTAQPELLRALDRSSDSRGSQPLAFKKVIVLVMETMTARNFALEGEQLAEHAFLRRERAHFHSFARYFPNNQDSRTGMLDMLFSRLIPYEAYSDEGVAHYRPLARLPSLVERMRELSFRAAFAVSQLSSEDVVGDLAWDEQLRLDEAQIASARGDHKLCFAPDEYESSCEDLVLLPKIVDFVARSEHAFVYQEFIWGHAAEYNEASGKSNAQYYSDYLDALTRALAERGLADETLIALTSDHGFRDRGRQHEPEVYRVPLLFYAPRFTSARDERLFSHVDFAALLFERLSPHQPRVASSPIAMIVGPTGQGHVFAVNDRGGHLLLREKLGLSMLIAREGSWQLAPGSILAAFEQYRAQFDSHMQRARERTP